MDDYSKAERRRMMKARGAGTLRIARDGGTWRHCDDRIGPARHASRAAADQNAKRRIIPSRLECDDAVRSGRGVWGCPAARLHGCTVA